jgi:hypothetical protein
MQDNLQQRIDQILIDMEAGQWTAEKCLAETRDQQAGVYDYLFTDENNFLSLEEKNQLLFLHAILWKIRPAIGIIEPAEIESLEEEYWAESDRANFPYDSEHPRLDALDDEVFAIVMDCTDAEIHDLTEIGAEWILVKGLVLSTLLQGE